MGREEAKGGDSEGVRRKKKKKNKEKGRSERFYYEKG